MEVPDDPIGMIRYFLQTGDVPVSIFELIMLVCFGISWPFAVYKSFKSHSTRGKSLVFLMAIWVGYVAGIAHKLIYSRDVVLWVYVFNLTMVSLDLVLFMMNRAAENRPAVSETGEVRL